jgi:hypothetical protein
VERSYIPSKRSIPLLLLSMRAYALLTRKDSDNLPTSDPSILFDSPSYNKLGALFFPDYWKTSPANPIWHILGVQCRDEWEMEAGQIIIDKGRHLDALLLSEWILKDWEFWFNFSFVRFSLHCGYLPNTT